jgi:hypothetical protein
MIYLKKAVDIVNQKDANEWGYLDHDQIIRGIKDAKVFIVVTDIDDKGIDVGGIESAGSKPFSLPFKTCWLEVMNGGLANWDMPSGRWELRGLLIEEYAPEKFNYVLLVDQSNGRQALYALHDDMDYEQHTEKFRKVAREAAFQTISRLNNRSLEAGVVNNHEKLKIKTAQGKIFHRIRKIIYVVSKKSRGLPIDGISQQVDWSHRWLVRGHWRSIAGLGKDRDGNYCIAGFTWVTEHEK